jgi:hypothetical protein
VFQIQFAMLIDNLGDGFAFRSTGRDLSLHAAFLVTIDDDSILAQLFLNQDDLFRPPSDKIATYTV